MSDDAHDPGETVGLVVERRGAVAVLRLDRRDARNALTSGLVGALGAAVVAADDEPDVRVIVLTGSGTEAFCAGMDLRSLAGGASPRARSPASRSTSCCSRASTC